MEHEQEQEQKPRGLWDVMRQQSDSPSTEDPTGKPTPSLPDSSPEPEQDEVEQEAVEPEENPDAPAAGKGLWAMMGVQPTPVAKSAPAELPIDKKPDSVEEEETAAPPPDWFRAKPEPEPEPVADDSEWEESTETLEEETIAESEFEEPRLPESEPAPLVVTAEESPVQLKRSTLTMKTGRSRGAMLSFLVGLFAIPLTLLAARPEIWTRIPATCLGFGALVLGLISFNEIQRSRGKQSGTGFAMAGMILGTIAMFLGPLVISPWSKNQNQTNNRQVTKDHLESIGSALRQHHSQHDHYPPGGTYRVEESGETTPMHSWMTELLPYLEAQSVYAEIHQNEPWSEPLNQPPMSKSIPAFLAGGVEEKHNRAGYGLSHFAGLGGQVQVNGGRMANVGLFDRSSRVTQTEVFDGLSQTLVAGEIPEGYRPWGEPGNWRTIGEGLNRDTTSFGNAQRTGAMFLKADGSVQFFSNNVSAEILKSLSTRDGEDNRLIPDKYR